MKLRVARDLLSGEPHGLRNTNNADRCRNAMLNHALRLDIYHPGQDGTAPIATTQNMNAAKLTVDFWRNVYTLNYDVLRLPGGGFPGMTEPSVSLWQPSTPQRPRVTAMGRTALRLAACFLGILAIASGAAAQSWTPTGSTSSLRIGSTTTLLSAGQVLIVGGVDNGLGPASLRALRPGDRQMDPVRSDRRKPSTHTATLLPSGQVLVAGGLQPRPEPGFSATASVEIYDPATGVWSATGSMNYARWQHTATLLPSGQVLVVGGFNDVGTNVGPPSSTIPRREGGPGPGA